MGCEFWPTVTPNQVWSIFDFAVGVINTGNAATDVVVERGGVAVAKKQLAAGAADVLYLPWVPALKGGDSDACGAIVPETASQLVAGGAYRLTSSAPIAAFQFSSWEYQGLGGPAGKSWGACPGSMTCTAFNGAIGCFSFSNDASMLLPTHALGTGYAAIGPRGWPEAKLTTAWVVTATEDDTTVTAQLGAAMSTAGGTGVTATGPGGSLVTTLARGDAVLVRGATAADDLSGAVVTATKPVQLVTAMSCTPAPLDVQACDHVEESVLPHGSLGSRYSVPVPTGPAGAVVGHMVKLVATAQTNFTYEGAPGGGAPATLAAGQAAEWKATGPFRVTGDAPFALMTTLLGGAAYGGTVGEQRGDPATSFIAPDDRRATRLWFVAPTLHEEVWVDVVSPAGAVVTVDGSQPAAAPQALPWGDQLHRVKLATSKLGHVVASPSGLAAQVLAYGKYTGVAYPAGFGPRQP